MGVYEARGQLSKSMKDLMIRWNEVQLAWHDANAERFSEEHIHQIESDLRTAVAAMDHMAVLLGNIRKDCQ